MSETRCYLIPELLERLQMSKQTFVRQRKAGALPFLEELRPRASAAGPATTPT